MKYVLTVGGQHLIWLLRSLIPSGGVLYRTWEFQSMFSGVDFFSSQIPKDCDTRLFPELPESWSPDQAFRVSGIRLVERVALAWDFQETILVRFAIDSPDVIDLRLEIDGGIVLVQTDDSQVVLAWEQYQM